jgi:hypothetical protein
VCGTGRVDTVKDVVLGVGSRIVSVFVGGEVMRRVDILTVERARGLVVS